MACPFIARIAHSIARRSCSMIRLHVDFEDVEEQRVVCYGQFMYQQPRDHTNVVDVAVVVVSSR